MEEARNLPEKSVHCVITSPPYWKLRDYQVEGQLGLEPTPELYVDNLVLAFAEIWRVLRDDGFLYVNLGDSYAGSGRGGYIGSQSGLQGSTEGQDQSRKAQESQWPALREGSMGRAWVPPPKGLKSKDLLGLPWKFAFAMREYGWHLRADVVWHKRSAMPESCVDRPSKDHEYVFLFSKKGRYFYDQMNAREKCTGSESARSRAPNQKAKKGELVTLLGNKDDAPSERKQTDAYDMKNQRTVWPLSSTPLKAKHFAAFPPELARRCMLPAPVAKGCCPTCGTAWARVFKKVRYPTRPGAKTKVNRWQEGPGSHDTLAHNQDGGTHPKAADKAKVVGNRDPERHRVEKETVGWWPRCKCYSVTPARRSNQDIVTLRQFDPALEKQSTFAPCVVMDNFHGAATTMKVAERLGASYVGIELSEEYLRIGDERPAVVFPHEKRQRKRKRKATVDTAESLPLFPEESQA